MKVKSIIMFIIVVIVAVVCLNKFVFNKRLVAYDPNKAYEIEISMVALKENILKSRIKGDKFISVFYDANGNKYSQVIYNGGNKSYTKNFAKGTEKTINVPFMLRKSQRLNMGVGHLINWKNPTNTIPLVPIEAGKKNINGFDCTMYTLNDITKNYLFGEACVNDGLGIAIYYKDIYENGSITYKLKNIREININDSEFELP